MLYLPIPTSEKLFTEVPDKNLDFLLLLNRLKKVGTVEMVIEKSI